MGGPGRTTPQCHHACLPPLLGDSDKLRQAQHMAALALGDLERRGASATGLSQEAQLSDSLASGWPGREVCLR